MTSFFGKIRKKWQLIIYLSLIIGAITFFVSTLIPPKYRSDITILVVQHNIDTFSASRSAEYLGEVFSQVLYTESFLNDVIASPLDINKEFSSDPKKKKKQWEKEVSINKISNVGILQIGVFDTSRTQAEKIAGGIGWNFITNGNKYHGSAENIEAKIIDGPITTGKPAYPNVFKNALFGFLAGLFGSLVLIYFFDGFDLKVFNFQKTVPSIVGREIQRQLKKRSQRAELKYPYDERDVYQIEKPTKQIEQEKNPNFLTRLYQKSLFADELFSKKKKEVVEKDHKEQQERDSAQNEIVEHVKKVNNIKDESDQMPWMGGDKTAPAPDNLPIFMQKDEIAEDVQIESESEDEIKSKFSQAEPELKREQGTSTVKEIKARSDEAVETDEAERERESSDDEVKDRLNKLLKGEL